MVLYTVRSTSVWRSNTQGYSEKIELVVQDDNDVVMYLSYKKRYAIWSTNTKDTYCPEADVDIGTSKFSVICFKQYN